MLISSDFWHGKRVLITGHTGFKGGWLSIFLNFLGADVYGYSLEPKYKPNVFELCDLENLIQSTYGDINDKNSFQKVVSRSNPDILFHMAAQPLVRQSYAEPISTFETNIMGTAKVLDATLKSNNIKAIINVTSDKCYENIETNDPYDEDSPMGGHDPYSCSKGCAELVASSYRRSFCVEKGIGLASVRAGNVIGGGDWSNDRLIPDIIRSISEKQKLIIRSPYSIRPWQHVLEPLSGYILLAEKLYDDPKKFSSGWNFGPDTHEVHSVQEIVKLIKQKWDRFEYEIKIDKTLHEANILKLDISKSKNDLGWKPLWGIDETLTKVVDWYREELSNRNIYDFTLNQIDEFINA